jgi:hypothetical protein
MLERGSHCLLEPAHWSIGAAKAGLRERAYVRDLWHDNVVDATGQSLV